MDKSILNEVGHETTLVPVASTNGVDELSLTRAMME